MPYPVFEAVRYDEIQRDMADTAGYRYSQKRDTVGYSGIQWDPLQNG